MDRLPWGLGFKELGNLAASLGVLSLLDPVSCKADCITGSIDNSQITLFKPYVTTVGLYDDNYDLLAVGKFAQPIKTSEETDMTFVIRWDTW